MKMAWHKIMTTILTSNGDAHFHKVLATARDKLNEQIIPLR
jgi:hypothetical protein